MGDFVISPLSRLLTKELCAAGPLCSTGVAPFQRYYGPSRHRLVFDRFPGASGYAVYLAPSISRRDEDGFSSCLACCAFYLFIRVMEITDILSQNVPLEDVQYLAGHSNPSGHTDL